MRLNEGVGSKVAYSLLMWLCILGYIGTSVKLVRVNVVYIMCFLHCVGSV